MGKIFGIVLLAAAAIAGILTGNGSFKTKPGKLQWVGSLDFSSPQFESIDITIPIKGGVKPYTCSISAGSLPKGITLRPDCHLVGASDEEPGTVNSFTIQVTDSNNDVLTMNVGPRS